MNGGRTGDALTLESFLGRWSLDRSIDDAAAGRNGVLTGEASFRPNRDGELLYEERGELQMEGIAPLMAERRYLWRRDEGHRLSIHFEDGRLFHRLNLDQTMPYDTHFCTPDVYDMTYDLRHWPVWECSARVEGPRKTYRLTSRYAYLGPLDSTA